MPVGNVFLDLDQVQPHFMNTRSRAEVERIAPPVMAGHRQQGLTRTQAEFKLSTTSQSVQIAPGRFCVGLAEVRGNWSLAQLDVDIVKELVPGSCAYAVTHAHESTHVSIGQRLFAGYADKIRNRLRQSVAGLRPKETSNPQGYVQILTNRISADVQGVLAEFQRDLKRSNAALDTPANYRAETSKCRDWP